MSRAQAVGVVVGECGDGVFRGESASPTYNFLRPGRTLRQRLPGMSLSGDPYVLPLVFTVTVDFNRGSRTDCLQGSGRKLGAQIAPVATGTPTLLRSSATGWLARSISILPLK